MNLLITFQSTPSWVGFQGCACNHSALSSCKVRSCLRLGALIATKQDRASTLHTLSLLSGECRTIRDIIVCWSCALLASTQRQEWRERWAALTHHSLCFFEEPGIVQARLCKKCYALLRSLALFHCCAHPAGVRHRTPLQVEVYSLVFRNLGLVWSWAVRGRRAEASLPGH